MLTPNKQIIYWRLLVVLILIASTRTHGYKILAFMPFPTNSHQNIFVGLIKVLAERGHEITFYTPIEPTVTHPNIKLKLTKNYKDDYLKEVDISTLGKISVPEVSHAISRSSEKLAEEFYGNPIAQEIIHSSDKYDAVLMESFFTQEPVSALIHKFGCVGIEVSTMGDSAWINEFAGIPHNPAYQVDFKSELSHEMTFLQRIYNVYVIGSTLAVSYYHMYAMQNIMDRYFTYSGWESRPPLQTLMANRSLILLNSDPVLSYPYPTAPHVKEIAGLNIKPKQNLPKELQKFMDEAKHGVIYFSFGSNLKTSDMIQGPEGRAFLKAFKKIPQRVLMKWEADDMELTFPPNVKTVKWLPQTDVLAHKNCILFITHGGLLSLTETVYFGVPIIGIPFFTDQFKNVLQAQTMGYGLMMKYDNITEDSVSWALKEITTNPRYRDVVKMKSQMFRDRRYTAQEEAIYWVEYAIKYPNALLPKSVFMSFWEKRIYDVGIFSVLSVIILYIIINFLVYISRKSKKTRVKKVKRS